MVLSVPSSTRVRYYRMVCSLYYLGEEQTGSDRLTDARKTWRHEYLCSRNGQITAPMPRIPRNPAEPADSRKTPPSQRPLRGRNAARMTFWGRKTVPPALRAGKRGLGRSAGKPAIEACGKPVWQGHSLQDSQVVPLNPNVSGLFLLGVIQRTNYAITP